MDDGWKEPKDDSWKSLVGGFLVGCLVQYVAYDHQYGSVLAVLSFFAAVWVIETGLSANNPRPKSHGFHNDDPYLGG